jgi:acetyl-CoA synthetase
MDVCYNIYEKHLDTPLKNKAAIIWEGIDGIEKVYTYQTLHYEVTKLAYSLKELGIKKGSKVFIFMPNLPEAVITILACAKLGAIHIYYNYKFSSEALLERILDSKPSIIITSDGSLEEGYYKVKGKLDEIYDKIENIVKYIIVVNRTGRKVKMRPFKELWYHELIDSVNFNDALITKKVFAESEDPLFIIYTATNQIQPKGLIHTTAGYLLWIFYTFELIFDIKDTDTYWCTFDLSSIVGFSYIIYGPLSLGTTTFIFEGTIDYEDANRFYEILEHHKITILYTHPHILRNLMNAYIKKKSFGNTKSLKLIATTGETVKIPLLRWIFNTLGHGVTPIIDIWFQAEAGGALISSIPCLVPPKAESIAKPIPGVDIALVDSMGNELEGETNGTIVIKKPHPAIFREILNDSSTSYLTYWNRYQGKNLFFTGDSAKRDSDDYIYLQGRIDNIINIEGRRVNLLEIESIILKIKDIDECAVISYNHPRKGSILAAFCVPDSSVMNEWQLSELEQEIKSLVSREIGNWINLQEIRFTQGLPKSPSGKLLRDMLREVALGME